MPFIYFGYFEADILAINTQNNEVVLMDSQNKSDFIMLSCAESSSSFLDILIEAASFNEKKAIDVNLDLPNKTHIVNYF